ncbi:MAG: hypothetical protein AAF808_17155 [Cyanobacteria bacterium P01_D01_bin.2]
MLRFLLRRQEEGVEDFFKTCSRLESSLRPVCPTDRCFYSWSVRYFDSSRPHQPLFLQLVGVVLLDVSWSFR